MSYNQIFERKDKDIFPKIYYVLKPNFREERQGHFSKNFHHVLKQKFLEQTQEHINIKMQQAVGENKPTLRKTKF